MSEPRRRVRATQRDLARMLGLDQSTVSRALHGDPRISEDRRRQVRAAAYSSGYVPNPQAAALVGYRRKSPLRSIVAELAWINIGSPASYPRIYKEFDLYWHGAVATAETLGYRLEEFSLGPELPASRLQKILTARNIEGIVIAPHGGLEIDWQDFPWDRFSVVRLGRNRSIPITHVVAPDQTSNAMLAYQEMRARGYRRIAFMGDPNPDKLFGAGFLWAQAHVPLRDRLQPYGIIPGQPLNQEQLRTWLGKSKPDAILMEDARLPSHLRSLGWKVPEDIALAGTTLLDTTATAGIDQKPREIGRAAISVLVSLLRERASGLPIIPLTTLIRGTWIDGPSLPAREC